MTTAGLSRHAMNVDGVGGGGAPAATRRGPLLSGLVQRIWVAMLVAAGFCSAATAAEDYRLSAGDTVEIAIAGVSTQQQRAVIQPDGTISLPPVGRVAIAGLTSAELQTEMAALLSTKLYSQRTQDGRENLIAIKPGDVTATIADYRPIYVTGDVLTPGQHPYRPQATVRQLVAISGGYSTLRARASNPNVDPADLQRDYTTTSIDYARAYVRALRLKAELDDKDTFDVQPLPNTPVSADVMKELTWAEAESLKTSLADSRQEKAFLQDAVKQADEQIQVLEEQERQEARGVQADQEELDRVTKLLATGNLTSSRVTDSRRALLLSSTRQLQAVATLMQTKRQRAESLRQLDRLDNQRRINVLRDLGDANARLADLSVRLQAIRARAQPNSAFAAAGSAPQINIVRSGSQGWQRLPATEDTEVEPGDVIEIALNFEAPGAGLAQR